MFFIVGLPRSGTTLLSSLLSSSDRVQVTSEIWFFNYWKEKYSFLDLSKEKELLFFLDKFLGSKRFTDLGVSERELREQILTDKTKWNFQDIFSLCLALFKAKEQVQVVGEKTPGQYKKIKELLDTYPEARVVCMIRDPRAVANSLIDAPFGSNFVSVTARRWVAYTRRVLRLTESNDRLLVVKYEDLVREPSEVIEAIRDFMKWPSDWEFKIDADRGSHFKIERDDTWSRKHFERANSPVSTDNIDKWKRVLTPMQIGIVEEVCGRDMAAFGYTPSTQKASASSVKLSLGIDRITSRITFILKQPNKLRRYDWYKRMSYNMTGDIYEKQ